MLLENYFVMEYIIDYTNYVDLSKYHNKVVFNSNYKHNYFRYL